MATAGQLGKAQVRYFLHSRHSCKGFRVMYLAAASSLGKSAEPSLWEFSPLGEHPCFLQDGSDWLWAGPCPRHWYQPLYKPTPSLAWGAVSASRFNTAAGN